MPERFVLAYILLKCLLKPHHLLLPSNCLPGRAYLAQQAYKHAHIRVKANRKLPVWILCQYNNGQTYMAYHKRCHIGGRDMSLKATWWHGWRRWVWPWIQLTISVTKYVKLKAIKSQSHVRNAAATAATAIKIMSWIT